MSILTPLNAVQTAAQEAKAIHQGYVHRVLVAFDQFMNVMIFFGRNDETISAHASRACLEGKIWGRLMSAFLNIFQADHGVKAQAGDAERARAILATEENSGGISPERQ